MSQTKDDTFLFEKLKNYAQFKNMRAEDVQLLGSILEEEKKKENHEVKEDVLLETFVEERDREFVKLQIEKGEKKEREKLERKRKWLKEDRDRKLFYSHKNVIERCIQLRVDEMKKNEYPDLLKLEEEEKKNKMEKEEKEALAKKAKLLLI